MKMVGLLAMALLAVTGVAAGPSLQEAEDLGVAYADHFFEGEAIVLVVEVTNFGSAPSPETLVMVSGWADFVEQVPPIGPEETVPIGVQMEIPPELLGQTVEFFVQIDPEGSVTGDFNPDNNTTVTPPIELVPPEVSPEAPPPEPEVAILVDRVQPTVAQQGQTLRMEVFGAGFQPGAELFVEGGAASVGETQVVTPDLIAADVSVDPSAAPGPRSVVVRNPDGTSARLEGAFDVRAPVVAPPPEPEVPTEIIPVVIAGIVGLAVVLGGLTLVVRAFSGPSRKKLQRQARQQDPPQGCQKGERWVKATEVGFTPGRWRVEKLDVQMWNRQSGESGRRYEASKQLVASLNEATRAQRGRRGDPETTIQHISLAGAEELAAQIVGWQALETTARDVWLEGHLEGGSADVSFQEYKCKGRPPGTAWEALREWTASVDFTDRSIGTLEGPKPDEQHERYVERIKGELEARLRALIYEVA